MRSCAFNDVHTVQGLFFKQSRIQPSLKPPAAQIGKLNRAQRTTSRRGSTRLRVKKSRSCCRPPKSRNMLTGIPLFLCAPRTGIRQGELVSLKGTDVDFNGRFIFVQRNLSRGKISATKNGKSRKVDMSRQLVDVLSNLLSKRRTEGLRREMEKPAEERCDAAAVVNEVMEGWLFRSPVGTQIDSSNLRKLFNRLLTGAELRRMPFQEQMGHSSINVTLYIYGHLVSGGNRQAVDKLDDRLPVPAKKTAQKQGLEQKVETTVKKI
jgi:integrase